MIISGLIYFFIGLAKLIITPFTAINILLPNIEDIQNALDNLYTILEKFNFIFPINEMWNVILYIILFEIGFLTFKAGMRIYGMIRGMEN